nr:MAG TPA: hypothetical protein [Bacteriophage sp.]
MSCPFAIIAIRSVSGALCLANQSFQAPCGY